MSGGGGGVDIFAATQYLGFLKENVFILFFLFLVVPKKSQQEINRLFHWVKGLDLC